MNRKNSVFTDRKKRNRKTVALVLAMLMLVGCVIGGTLAWLTAESTEVTNVFTTSDINLVLTESDTDPNTDGNQYEYKMIPGWTIPKDPHITVKAGSEDCWLFVQVTESSTLDKFIEYVVGLESVVDDSDTSDVIEGGWKQGDGTNIPTNVFYRRVTTSANDQVFGVIGYYDESDNFVADTVKVKDDVTKEDMESLKMTGATAPTLTFTAYASQYWKSNKISFDAKDAWAIINPAPSTP